MLSSVVSPVLVGRVAELAAVRAAYERAWQRRPVTALISGEAGIGKSRLVATALADLPGDPLVLTGGCLELGAEGAPYVPFVAILRQLVQSLGRPAVDALLPLAGSALGTWLPEFGPAPAAYGRTRLLEELLTLIGRVSEVRPVVLVVEDLHWADASSRELFVYLARNLTDRAVLLIGTARTEEHPGRQLLAELGRRADVVRIDLAPLDRRHVGELLTAIDGRPPDPSWSSRIHRRSGGNPLFVEALTAAGEAPVTSLTALLLDRVTDLPPDARELLGTISAAGAGVSDELLRAVSDLPDARLQPALRTLVERGPLVVRADGYAIRHDLIREAVYQSLLPGERRQLHARYARALADEPEATAALAEHWSAAAEPTLALPAAWRAAQRAGRQYAYDEELNLLERVLTLWDQVSDPAALIGTTRATVLERAATVAFAAGRSSAGIAHSTAALTELDPAAEPERVARLLGLRAQLHNRFDGTGGADLDRALSLVPPGVADRTRSHLLSTLAVVNVVEQPYEPSMELATEALRIADRLADDGLRAPALLALAWATARAGDLARAEELFASSRRLAESVGDHLDYLTTLQWEGGTWYEAGEYARAAELAHTGLQAAERLGQGRSKGSILAGLYGGCLISLGRWDEALETIEDALATDPPPLFAAMVSQFATAVTFRRGEEDRFDEQLSQLMAFARENPWATIINTPTAMLRIMWAAERGDPELADRLLAAELADPPSPATAPLLTMRFAVIGARAQRARRAANPRNRQVAVEIAARQGQLARLVAAVTRDGGEIAAQRLTFAAEVGSGSLADWDRAAAAWRDLGDPYELATALTAAAGAALASSNRSGARLRLREARTLAADLRAAPLLERIDELAARARLDDGAAPAGTDLGLTSRELDVLRVLARGRSNAEIATELFISVNTVATHVARILTKLGVSTRTEAATIAHRAGLTDTKNL